jgi:predicted DNA-binding transcriptional regulator AlpA
MTKPQSEAPLPERQELPALALTIPEFCVSHGISQALFYELQKDGRGPRTMRIGRRRLISLEEARRWREAHTASAM